MNIQKPGRALGPARTLRKMLAENLDLKFQDSRKGKLPAKYQS